MKEQTIAKAIGATGCYFVSILYLAEKVSGNHVDIIEAYKRCYGMGLIEADCFVKEPAIVLSMYAGKNYEVTRQTKDYEIQPGELCSARWAIQTTMRTDGHFVVWNGVVEYDPLGESNTVKNGSLESLRVFREVL